MVDESYIASKLQISVFAKQGKRQVITKQENEVPPTEPAEVEFKCTVINPLALRRPLHPFQHPRGRFWALSQFP